MIGVDKIEDMRRRARRSEPIVSIARTAGVSEPTARKYARMGDLSPEPPRRRRRMIMSRAKCGNRQSELSTSTWLNASWARCTAAGLW